MTGRNKGQNREEKSKISGLIEDIERKTYAEGYADGFSDGKEAYFHYICEAFNWFKATYNTEYVLYDSDSITHLLDMYKDSLESIHNTAEEIGDNIVREDK